MRKLFTFMCMVAVTLGLSSCYDDSKLWNKVGDLDDRLTALEKTVKTMNEDIEAMDAILATLQQGGVITDVVATENGYELTVSGRPEPIVITNGKDGQTGAAGLDAPVIGVKQDTDGVYYWTITKDGQTDWLTDGENKLPVSGKDGASGVTPVMGVDDEGYWTVDYGQGPERIPGDIQATGGDTSFFESVTEQDGVVTITLANGTQLTLPVDRAVMAFVATEDGLPVAVRYGAEVTVSMTFEGMQHAEVLSAPTGWSASMDFDAATVTVSAPAEYVAGVALEGKVSVIGLSNNGQTMMAVQDVYVVDYTHPDGAFVVMEGNMSNQNGTLCYIDQYGRTYEHVYEDANDGHSVGNVLQDMWIAGDRIVLLTQNGIVQGNGDGKIVICNAHTMKKQQAYNDVNFNANRESSATGCPQHLAVIGDKAFIQYVDEAMEYNSGIKVFDLSSGELATDDIEGTFGTFAVSGALKGRMWASHGMVVAGLANAVVFIDANTEQVTKKVEFPNRQVKGVVKGADGNFHVALSGEFTGAPNSQSTPPTGAQLVGIDHSGNTIYTYDLPDDASFDVSTWSPTVNMAGHFTEPYIYLVTGGSFSMMSLDRFNYETQTLERDYIAYSGFGNSIYGYPGVHPSTGYLYVGQSIGYVTTRVSVYDPASLDEPMVAYDYQEASPAGIDFAYRFSDKFIAL